MKSRFSRAAALHSGDMEDDLMPPDPVKKIRSALAPCQPEHPYLAAHGLLGTSAQVYTGIQEINGFQCHGAIAIPLFNIDGQEISFALLAKASNNVLTATPLPDVEWAGCFGRIGTPSDTLLVSIDWASGISVHIATGEAVVVAVQEENLAAVCRGIARKYPSRRIIICDDLRTTGSHTTAMNVAEEMNVALALPYRCLSDASKHASFNALHRNAGIDVVRMHIDVPLMPGTAEWDAMVLEREIARLSALSEIAYEQQRAQSAKRFNARAQFIDKKVEEAREKRVAATLRAESLVEPYPELVEGQVLLQDLVSTVRRFTVLTPSAAVAVALWTIFTYVINSTSIAPILGLVSPVKRCGKTTLLTLLERLCFTPLTTSNITSAALFRCIQLYRPTLLIDEGDTFIHGSSELNGIVNSGHSPTSAYVVRVVEGRPVRFSTFCAKAIAVIGRLPETMQDRTIIIPLRRKRASETVESIRNTADTEFRLLKAKIHRWTIDNAAQISMARPALDGVCSDRAIDNWEPLIAIASRMGDQCLAAAQIAAVDLSGTHAHNRSAAEDLLADVQDAFESARFDRIASSRLIEIICMDEEKPWATYDRGRSISSRQLAGLLAVFGISSKNLRISPAAVVKGYDRLSFSDAFERYLGAKDT